jgi:hypothetical protein
MIGGIKVQGESGRRLTFTIRGHELVDAPKEVVTANPPPKESLIRPICEFGYPRNVSSWHFSDMPGRPDDVSSPR